MPTKCRSQLMSMLLVTFCAGWLIQHRTAVAEDDLREPLSKIAKAVAQVVKDRGADTIAIGEFTGPPSFASAAGAGIRKTLAEEFMKVGIREKKIGAAIGIQGKYIVHQDRAAFAGAEPGPPHLRIIASLVDKNGQVLTELNVEVNVKVGDVEGEPIMDKTKFDKGTVTADSYGGAGPLAEALGATIDLEARGKQRDQRPTPEDVIKSFDRPSAVILANGTAVAAGRESRFFMEILVDNQPRSITPEDGHPFVELLKGESFQIRFTNRESYDVAVTFLLDGVNSYAFSTVRETKGPRRGEARYSKWIVPRGQSFTLKGWHINNSAVDKFLVTDFSDSAAAKLGSAGGLGTITATVRATWREGENPPPGEAIYTKVMVGVGRGERDSQQVQEDTAKREYGQPRAVITVRYAKPGDQ